MSSTAQTLGMSVANISRTCQRFEHHFSFPIFEKTRKGVIFTPAAKALFAEIEHLDTCIMKFSERVCSNYYIAEIDDA